MVAAREYLLPDAALEDGHPAHDVADMACSLALHERAMAPRHRGVAKPHLPISNIQCANDSPRSYL